MVEGWGEERLECGAAWRVVSSREGAKCVAVVGILPGDEVDTGGVIAGDVVLAGELEGGLYCF